MLDAVLARHDVLRAHLAEPYDEPDPVLRVPEVGAVTGAQVLTHVRAGESDDLRALVDAHIATAMDQLDLWSGPLLHAVWVDAGPSRPGRLALIAHHLVVDDVSWRLLLDDVAHAHRTASTDADGRVHVPSLPRHGLSFLGWARSLRDAAGSRRTELTHWRRVADAVPEPLSPTPLDPVRDTAATAVRHEIWLDPGTTRTLLTTLPSAYRTSPDPILLTALTSAVRAWRGGEPELLVALESRGRPQHTADRTRPVELSHTVGCFTAIHPARLQLTDTRLPEALTAVMEQVHAQGDGLGYGVLTFAADQPLAAAAEPAVRWNYLGQVPGSSLEEAPWQTPPDADPVGFAGGDMPLPYSLMITALARENGDGNALGVRFTWPSALFTTEEIQELAEHFRRALVQLATDLGGSGTSPR